MYLNCELRVEARFVLLGLEHSVTLWNWCSHWWKSQFDMEPWGGVRVGKVIKPLDQPTVLTAVSLG